MSNYHFSSMRPIDGTIKKPIIENASNHKSEQYVTTTEGTTECVRAAVSVTKYNFTVQTKVESSSQAHFPTKFGLGQQRHATPPISEQMGKLKLGHDKEDRPSSPITNHKLNPLTKAEQMKDYEVVNNTRNRPESPILDRSHSSQGKVEPVKDYKVIEKRRDKPLTEAADQRYRSPIKVGPPTNYEVINGKHNEPLSPGHGQSFSLPPKGRRVINEKPDKPSTLVRYHGYKSPTKRADETKIYRPADNQWGKTTNPVHESPKKVEDILTEVQTEASRPTKPGFLNGRNWHNLRGNNGYGGHMNNGNQNLGKPSSDTVRYEGVVAPHVPHTQLTPMCGPTNDIGEAVDVLKELVKSAPPPQYNFNYPELKNSITDAYPEIIDSREAQRRYGNPNSSSRPSLNHRETISSTDAARKYGGKPV